MNRFNNKPIVALDIDGTLGDYHGHFTRFAEQWTGRTMPDPHDINPGRPLYQHLGMSKATYRQCKLAYRQGGMKRSMPVYDGARELTVAIRKAGAEVYICTTRPYLRLDNIDPDTRHWLRRNGIQFDGVLFGQHKYRDLVKFVGAERIVAVLDDLPELCAQAESLGLRVMLRDQPYNKHVTGYPRVMDLEDNLLAFMIDYIKRHKLEA
jgi:FMN phosphatase YigB (HAD superfamily)